LSHFQNKDDVGNKALIKLDHDVRVFDFCEVIEIGIKPNYQHLRNSNHKYTRIRKYLQQKYHVSYGI
jgi:hypothetical protein